MVDFIFIIFVCFCGLQEEFLVEELEDVYEDTIFQDVYEDITFELAKSFGGLIVVVIYDY